MTDERRYPKRRTIRLPDYDYAQPEAYFITICAHMRRCIFGEIADCEMRPNRIGSKVAEEFLRSFDIRREFTLDAWVLMPNHIHAILIISETHEHGQGTGDLPVAPTKNMRSRRGSVGSQGRRPAQGPLRRSLSSFVAGFKAAATRRVRGMTGQSRGPIWQRNYYEHVIRNEEELERVRLYIAGNAQSWNDDEENPANLASRKKKLTKPWL